MRQGIEHEATVHMGPSAIAMERLAEHRAMREGKEYKPVTQVGQHNAGVMEKRGLRQYVECGSAWLRDRRAAAEAERAAREQERLAAERQRQAEIARRGMRERAGVAERLVVGQFEI